MRLAIPIFRSRVSPVFDSARRVMVFDIENYGIIQHSVIWIPGSSLVERSEFFKESGIKVLICASIGRPLRTILLESGIRVIDGVVGDVQEVLSAFMEGTLNHPRFLMPGCPGKAWRRRCRRGPRQIRGDRRT